MDESKILRLARQIVKDIPVDAIKDTRFRERVVEIVVRRSDGKISSMIKCALDNSVNEKKLCHVLPKIPIGAITGVNTISSLANNVQTQMVRRELKKVGKDVKEVLELTKNISVNVDKIAVGMSVVQSLSLLNIALSAVNIGVSIAGNVIMDKKLDALHRDIHIIYELVTDLKDMKIIELVNEGDEIIAKTKGLYQHIVFNDAEIREYEYILRDYRRYIRNLRDNVICEHIDYEHGYRIIMGLLPEYISILKKYVIEVYYTKGEFPQYEYDTHISVIQSLTNQEFLEKLFDFIYLNYDISKTDSETAQGIHLLLVGNAYTEVEDTKNLILALPEKKDYVLIDKIITAESQRILLNSLPETIDGLNYNRKELVKEIRKLDLIEIM